MFLLSLVLAQAPLVTETRCQGFSVRFTSPSGVPTEDDGRVEVGVEGAWLPLALAPAMFTSTAVASQHAAVVCREGLMAWQVRPQVVVLVLSRSGRPSLDLISLAVVDLARRKVLAVKDTTWAIASGRSPGPTFAFVARPAKGGFDLRAVREWLRDDDGPTGAIEDWLAVRVSGDRLSATWLRP